MVEVSDMARSAPLRLLLTTAASAALGRAAPLPAQQSSPGADLVREASVEGITAYRIPSNGLQVLLYPDATKPQTLVNGTELGGAREEGPGETGMAHLLEHMMVKGTPDHPDISKALETRGARDPARDQIRITGRREGSVVVIEVSDTGPGVSEKARAHMFQAFQGSTRAGGTGLGLAIAAELVRAHGGNIRLVPGTIGATFSITIPDRAVDLNSRRGERVRA